MENGKKYHFNDRIEKEKQFFVYLFMPLSLFDQILNFIFFIHIFFLNQSQNFKM